MHTACNQSNCPDAKGFKITFHLVFQFVTVQQQNDGGLFGLRRFVKHLSSFDDGEGFTAALCMPHQASSPFRFNAPVHYQLNCFGLVLHQDNLV